MLFIKINYLDLKDVTNEMKIYKKMDLMKTQELHKKTKKPESPLTGTIICCSVGTNVKVALGKPEKCSLNMFCFIHNIHNLVFHSYLWSTVS